MEKRRLISVLTDLDLAEFHRANGNYDHALNVASVALINALEGHKACPVESDEFDEWEEAVHRAFAVKRSIPEDLRD